PDVEELLTQLERLLALVVNALRVPDVEELLTQLETRLHENPNNPEGWFMLARTRMSLGQYAQSAEAFLQLAKLLESEPREAAAIYGLYAQALYFARDRKSTRLNSSHV